MTDYSHQHTYRPRRPIQPPLIDPGDRPDPEELARARAQLARRLRRNRFISG